MAHKFLAFIDDCFGGFAQVLFPHVDLGSPESFYYSHEAIPGFLLRANSANITPPIAPRPRPISRTDNFESSLILIFLWFRLNYDTNA